MHKKRSLFPRVRSDSETRRWWQRHRHVSCSATALRIGHGNHLRMWLISNCSPTCGYSADAWHHRIPDQRLPRNTRTPACKARPSTHTRTDQRSTETIHRRSMWTPPFLYPPPASVYVTAMSAVSLVSLANAGLSELRGEHMAYSKFWHVMSAAAGGGRGSGGGALLPSRVGMLVAYAPALVAAAASFAVPGAVEGGRAQLLSAALAVHFLKRVLEVLFVHRYSGNMPLATAATISSSYLLSTVNMIYALHLSRDLPDPAIDLLYPGVIVFAIGITGNFYHHYLLSSLRADSGGGDKGYKIPKGGLFEFVTCPHYLFEIMGFFGFAMISQTVYALAVASGTAAYLTGRSCATRRWYKSKFEEFPSKIKALLPYIL